MVYVRTSPAFDVPTQDAVRSIKGRLARPAPDRLAYWSLGVPPEAALSTASHTILTGLKAIFQPMTVSDDFLFRGYAIPVHSIVGVTDMRFCLALYNVSYLSGVDEEPTYSIIPSSVCKVTTVTAGPSLNKVSLHRTTKLRAGEYAVGILIDVGAGSPTLPVPTTLKTTAYNTNMRTKSNRSSVTDFPTRFRPNSIYYPRGAGDLYVVGILSPKGLKTIGAS